MNRLSPAITILFTSVAIPVFGATDIYVAAGGDDANDGLTPATAKATIAGGYDALTNGLPAATYGNRLVVGEGTFNLPSVTTVLSNGWKIVGEGKDKTTLKVTTKVRQFSLASNDTELRGFKVDFVGSSMDMKKDVNNSDLYGALAMNPKGILADLDVVNYYTSWGGTLLHINTAGVSPVVTNCTFRNFRITYRNELVKVNDVASSLMLTHCSFIDGACGSYYTYGTVVMDQGNGSIAHVTIRNCLFLRCKNYQDTHKDKYRSGTIHCNKSTTVEDCSLIDCSFVGSGFRTNVTTWADLCGPIIKNGTVVNTLVYGCKNEKGELQPCSNASFTYSANDAALLAGEGNIQVAPGSVHFQNVREDRFIPVDGPTVNAGTTLSWMSGSTDIRGKARINGAAPDIGCWEYYAPNVYYMSADGNDANDGLTPATAKATIGAAAALLSDIDEKLVVDDGTYPLPAETISLSNGCSIVSVNGPESTTFYATSVARPFFEQTTAGTLIRGFTVDFRNISFTKWDTCSFLYNAKGLVENCILEHYYYNGLDQNGMPAMVRVGNSDAPVFSNVVFRNSYSNYRASFVNVRGSSSPVFLDCTFSDLKVSTRYYSYGTVYVDKKAANPTFRNCLFLRCQNNQDTHKYFFRTAVIQFYDGENTSAIDNCSFIDCSFVGGGFKTNDTTWAEGCGVIIKGGRVNNCLFLNCTNELGNTQFSTKSESASKKPVWTHCAAETALDGEGNILVSAANMRYRCKRRGDYTIVSGPTVNAGTSLSWHSGATDLYGRNRVIGPAVDIGCGEFDPSEIKGAMLIFK